MTASMKSSFRITNIQLFYIYIFLYSVTKYEDLIKEIDTGCIDGPCR